EAAPEAWRGLYYTTRGESQIRRAFVDGEWNDEGAGLQNLLVLKAPQPPPAHNESRSFLPVKTEPKAEGGEVCAPELNCSGTTTMGPASNNNTVGYETHGTKPASAEWRNTLTQAGVFITQEQGPK